MKQDEIYETWRMNSYNDLAMKSINISKVTSLSVRLG